MNHVRLALAAGVLTAGTGLCAPAEADAIFAVFENPAASAVAVKGAATDRAMAQGGALPLDSIAFGIENPLVITPGNGATGPGRPSFRPLSLTLPLGPGVPALLQTSGTGGHYGNVTVHFRTGGEQPVEYATLSLKLVVVSGVEIAASGGGPPQATVALSYGAMKLDYFAQDATGALARTPETGQWNTLTGTADFSAKP